MSDVDLKTAKVKILVKDYNGSDIRNLDFLFVDAGFDNNWVIHQVIYASVVDSGYPAFVLSPSLELEYNCISHLYSEGRMIIGNSYFLSPNKAQWAIDNLFEYPEDLPDDFVAVVAEKIKKLIPNGS